MRRSGRREFLKSIGLGLVSVAFGGCGGWSRFSGRGKFLHSSSVTFSSLGLSGSQNEILPAYYSIP